MTERQQGSIDSMGAIEWSKVRRVFIGTLTLCKPCHSEKFIECISQIIMESLKNGFTVILGSAPVESKALEEAEKTREKHKAFSYPYARVFYKDQKPETYVGVEDE